MQLPTTLLPLGTSAPDFTLPDTEGNCVSLSQFDGVAAYLIMFICNHCPYVLHLRKDIARLSTAYQERDVAVLAINSNDAEKYPADSPERMREEATDAGYTFPYLYDSTQSVAKAYRATCTPDFYIFDKHRNLAYHGQFDDARPGNMIAVSGSDLSAALDSVLDGDRIVPDVQKPSFGCTIKWKPGNEPDYFVEPS